MSDAKPKTEAQQELQRVQDMALVPSDLSIALAHLLSPYDSQGHPKEQASTMIWGAMGIGKTDIVRQIAAKWRCRVVALHLPQMDPTDLKGIPVKIQVNGRDRVIWKPSSYLPQEINITVDRDMVNEKGVYNSKLEFEGDMPSAEDVSVTVLDPDGNVVYRYNDQMSGDLVKIDAKATVDMVHKEVSVNLTPSEKHPSLIGYTIVLTDKAILFLDELSASVPQVQNAALQLVLDKRVGEYDVPTNTPIVAAGNRESDAAFVHPMSAPLSNRFCHLRLDVSLDDWMEWAMPRKVHPHVIGYLKSKGVLSLLNFEPDKMAEGDGGFATPRSWYKLSQQMSVEQKKSVMQAIIAGFIGKAMAADFIAYRDVAELLPSTDDILSGRITEILDENGDPMDMDLGQRYYLSTALCYKLHDYHNKYYDESIDEPTEQPDEWRIAATAFVDFIHKHLGKEMTVLCIHIVSRHLDISFTRFKGDKGNKFAEFSLEYRDILRKIV